MPVAGGTLSPRKIKNLKSFSKRIKYLAVLKKYFTFFNLIFLTANVIVFLLLVCRRGDTDTSAVNESVFEFRIKSYNVFQFDETRATDAQKAINKKISDAKNRYLRDFESDFSEFLSESETGIACFLPSLEIKTQVRINSPEFFSARMDIVPWHQGACGNPTEVETFNFALVGNEIKELTLADVVPNESERIELLWCAFQKIRGELRNKLLADITEPAFKENCLSGDGYLKHIKFTLAENGMEIIFPSGLLTSRAVGPLSAFVEICNK